eukprot:scpid49977/ scgid13641/ 
METLPKAEAFITMKDHKPRFESSLPCRLINPAKPDMGRLSKGILDKVIRSIVERQNMNLWKNTAAVLKWFQAIPNKQSHSFICFDVVDFYPSITEPLLRSALALILLSSLPH